MTITRQQHELLKSFFFAMSLHYNKGIKTDFIGWSQLLDHHNIKWSLQNTVANLAENYQNTGFYLSTLLAKKGVAISC